MGSPFTKEDHKMFAPACKEISRLAKYDSNSGEIRQQLDGNMDLRDYLSSVREWDGEVCTIWHYWNPPLHSASVWNSLGNMTILVRDYHMCVNAVWKYSSNNEASSMTPLFYAIWNNQLEAVEKLLALGADPMIGGTYHGQDFTNARMVAEYLNRHEIVQHLKDGE